MKKYAPHSHILGVVISGRSINAVLVDDTPEGPQVVQRFSRQAVAFADSEGVTPSTQSASDFVDEAGGTDFTIKFGNSGSNSDLFLSSEFNDLNPQSDGIITGDKAEAMVSLEIELEDILSQCREAGYPDPLVAFCESAAAVSAVEVRSGDEPADDGDGAKKKKRKSGVAGLIDILNAELDSDVDPERVGFVPMTAGEDGSPRYLALLSKELGPASSTLGALRRRKSRMPSARLLDNEISLYVGLARTAYYLATSDEHDVSDEAETADAFAPSGLPPIGTDTRKTLVVRAGLEDTLVLFLDEEKLLHYESLRSITTYDAPETICSRVLLLQDEYGIGDIQHVLLLSDDREDAIIESFKMFFSDTRVEALADYIPKVDNPSDGAEFSTSTEVMATGAALRLVSDELYGSSFDEINLLPKELLKRRIKIPISWHVMALYGLLFVSALFWVSRYFSMESKVADRRQLLEQYPAEYTEADPAILQARVDSLRRVTEGYQRALVVLDSLLRGSDAWSRSLALTSTETANVRGIWIDSWRSSGQQLRLKGNATSRDRIVDFAQRTNGEVESVAFEEIRDWPVYSFTMNIALPNDLPEAATYLREQVRLSDEANNGFEGSP